MILLSKRTVIILIDALGFEMSERHGFRPAALPHRTRLRTVLGFSQAALTSILTGSAPDIHGLWMMYSFATGRSPFGILGGLKRFGGPDRLWVRDLLRWKLARMDRISAYYSLYDIPGEVLRTLDLPARKSTFDLRGGGMRRTIIDQAHDEGETFVRDYNTPEVRAFDELESALEKGETRFHLLYTAGLDSDLHSVGSIEDSIGTRLAGYSERIDSILSRFPDVRCMVLGDHGMCDVTDHIDLMGAMENAGLKICEDYIPFYDSTMARFRVFSEEASNAISELLNDFPGGRFLDNGELKSLGVFFPGSRYGDLVFLCDPGTIILPSYMGSDPVKGMHGYHPDSPCMDSIMLSNEEYGGEAQITDIAGFLLPGFKEGGVQS